MFESLWRRWWGGGLDPVRGKRLRGGRPPSCRPRLESLEARELPATLAGGLPALTPARLAATHVSTLTPAPDAFAAARPSPKAAASNGSQPIVVSPPGAGRIVVTVDEDAAARVIDLGAVFGEMTGVRRQDGLRLAMLGNTNSGLVKTDLSEAALTLSFASGKSGAATLSVCATDADGVSVRETILVTVLPRNPTEPTDVARLSPHGPDGEPTGPRP